MCVVINQSICCLRIHVNGVLDIIRLALKDFLRPSRGLFLLLAQVLSKFIQHNTSTSTGAIYQGISWPIYPNKLVILWPIKCPLHKLSILSTIHLWDILTPTKQLNSFNWSADIDVRGAQKGGRGGYWSLMLSN